MYSNEDIREIIRSVMTECTISSESVISKTPVEMAQQNTGSQIILDVGDDVRDLQSVIEIDQRKSQDNSLIESRRVTVKEYTITTTHQSSMAIKIRGLSNDGATNRKKLKELELLLNECELFTFAEEKRIPVPSNDYNPNGYTHESANFDGSKIIITKKDDYFRINHDCDRLFALMNLVRNKDLHYLITSRMDFMSYAAEHLNVDIINRKTIMAGRVIMPHEIKRLSEDPEYVELHMLPRIFHAIVDSVRPPVIEREAPPPQEVHTFSVMSTSEGNQEACYGDLSSIDTEDDMEYEGAVDTFDQPNYWEDTSDATINLNAALRNKDMQREDTTPLDKSKQERDLRNLYNFPDTPEIFTPQRKKPRKSEVKAVQERQEYDHKTYDADIFPIQPPLSPAQQLAPTPPRRYTPNKSPEPRTPATPQSTPQHVAIGMYGNGAP